MSDFSNTLTALTQSGRLNRYVAAFLQEILVTYEYGLSAMSGVQQQNVSAELECVLAFGKQVLIQRRRKMEKEGIALLEALGIESEWINCCLPPAKNPNRKRSH